MSKIMNLEDLIGMEEETQVIEESVVVNEKENDDDEFSDAKEERKYLILRGAYKGKEAKYLSFNKEKQYVTIEVEGVGVKKVSKAKFNDKEVFKLIVKEGEVVCSRCGKRRITEANKRFLQNVLNLDGIPQSIKDSIANLDVCTNCQNHLYFYEGVKMPLREIYKTVKALNTLSDKNKLKQVKEVMQSCKECNRQLTKAEIELNKKYKIKNGEFMCASHLLDKLTK